jgi:hypothetical protein
MIGCSNNFVAREANILFYSHVKRFRAVLLQCAMRYLGGKKPGTVFPLKCLCVPFSHFQTFFMARYKNGKNTFYATLFGNI